MKLSRSIFVLILLFSVLAGCASKPSLKKDYHTRLVKLHDKIDTVETSLAQVKGYPQKAGQIDLQVAKFFAQYIAWELEHPKQMKEALALSGYYKRIKLNESERNERYYFTLDYELTGAMEILNQAMARLDSDKKWPEVKEIQWDKVKYKDGFFRENGKPVFFSGFNLFFSADSICCPAA
jgi:hypothetical protein